MCFRKSIGSMGSSILKAWWALCSTNLCISWVSERKLGTCHTRLYVIAEWGKISWKLHMPSHTTSNSYAWHFRTLPTCQEIGSLCYVAAERRARSPFLRSRLYMYYCIVSNWEKKTCEIALLEKSKTNTSASLNTCLKSKLSYSFFPFQKVPSPTLHRPRHVWRSTISTKSRVDKDIWESLPSKWAMKKQVVI